MLTTTQTNFQRYVLHGDRTIVDEIAGGDDAWREARLRIYYDAYRLRLVEVLGGDFETLRAFVGAEDFDALARDYIHAHPSVFRNVRWMGGRLAGFLQDDARYRDRPVLAELAAFEWTLGLAFDAPDAPLLSFDELAGLPAERWAGLRLHLHPSLHTLTLHWNVLAIWNFIAQQQPAPAARREPQPVSVALWRQDYKSHFRSLPEDEAQMLRDARNGATFPEICERLALQQGDDAAMRAAGLLRTWVDQGWLSGYTVSA
ncbi:MAG TPA: DNA-binding domain-containing protein [Burkholderiales bacterium]|nr:DNA-binding domain-containing protein [Burkholderiales bacterium]